MSPRPVAPTNELPSVGGSGVQFLRQWQVPAPIAPWSFSTDLTGVYLLVMVPSRVTADEITRSVPSGFRPTPDTDGKYRNILSFGYQQYVRPAWSPRALSFSYLECISGLPGLSRDAESGPQRYSTMLKLYLDSLVATVLGEIIGLPKIRAHVTSAEETMTVRTRSGELLIEADFQPRGPVMKPSDSPVWDRYGRMFEETNVSRLFIGPLIGTTVRFSLDDALLQSVSARIRCAAGTLPGLRQGVNEFPGIDQDPAAGALQLRLPWRMSWPKLLGR